MRRTIFFMGGGAPKKGAGKNEKYKKHAARRGGSGTGGAVAQFSTGRRCGYWQCTGRLWSSGFAAAPHSKPAGVALATPLVGDRVRLAPRPHRSLRRPLPRRLFPSAPAAHAPAAARRFPSSCTRPRRPPPSTPLVATLTATAGRTPCRHGVDPGQQWEPGQLTVSVRVVRPDSGRREALSRLRRSVYHALRKCTKAAAISKFSSPPAAQAAGAMITQNPAGYIISER